MATSNLYVAKLVEDWLSADMAEVLNLKEKKQGPYKAFCIMCAVLYKMKQSQTPSEIAKYFNVSVDEVRTAIKKHDLYECSLSTYKVIYRNILNLTNDKYRTAV